MADHKRPNLKQIRIKQSVCARLDERKGKDDSYTDVIKALLDENERLKARVEEVQTDKQMLVRLALLKSSTPTDLKGENAKSSAIRLSNSKEQRDRMKDDFDEALQDW